MKPEMIIFWTAVTLYGISAVSYVFGLIAKQEKLFSLGFYTAALGFIPHVAFIAKRWIDTGVSPFFDISESLTLGVFMTMLIFLIVQFSTKKIRPIGVLVAPIAFILLTWAGTIMKDAAHSLNPALQSGWIWMHIFGATTGFASILIAAAISILYLLKEKFSGGIYDKLPSLEALDTLAYRFVAGGFILYGVMLVSGCFWSNQVKGNYWGWDPVEVWSLVSWLVYGIYLHLRVTFGWRGKRLAWYAVIAMFLMIVSYWGIPFFTETFHSGFRIDHS